MIVEYAGIVVRGRAPGVDAQRRVRQSVAAVFASSGARRQLGHEGGARAQKVSPAGREGGVQARAVRQAGAQVPLRARLDRRHEEPAVSASSTLARTEDTREAAGRDERDPREREARARSSQGSAAIVRRDRRSARSSPASSRPAWRAELRLLSADSEAGWRRPPSTRRRLTTPRIVSPSTTGRCRKPLSSMTCAASSSVMSGGAVIGSAVIHWRTRASLVCTRAAIARSMSRSVRIADEAAEVLHDDRADVLARSSAPRPRRACPRARR